MKPHAVHVQIRRMVVDRAFGDGITAAGLAGAIQSELASHIQAQPSEARSLAPPLRQHGRLAGLVASEIAERLGANAVVAQQGEGR